MTHGAVLPRIGLTRRVLWSQTRRGVAPFAALTGFCTELALFAAHPDNWAGRWSAWAFYSRTALLILCPVAVVLGTWQAGREHRRRATETVLLAPRAVWATRAVTSVAVTLGLLTGSAAALGLLAAVDVAPLATYSGGGWWWPLLVSVPALLASAAVGIAVGTLVPWRLAAPVAGLATYVLLGSAVYQTSPAVPWLAPNIDMGGGGFLVASAITRWQAIWFVALAVTGLAVASVVPRRPLRATAAVLAGAGAVAVLAATTLLTGPAQQRDQATTADPSATAPICARRAALTVCTARENAFLLPEFADRTASALARFDSVPGLPTRVEDSELTGYRPSPDLSVVTIAYALDGGLFSRPHIASGYEQNLVANLFLPQCPSLESPLQDLDDAGLILTTWLDPPGPDAMVPFTPTAARTYDRLRAAPSTVQLDWVGRYLAAARTCDATAARRLTQPDSVHP